MSSDRQGRMKDLVSMQEKVNRLFEDVMERAGGEGTGSHTWSPAVDICEAEHAFIVNAEVPEVLQDDIEIKVEKNILLIRGERKLRSDRVRDSFHRMERKHGFFRRSFRLPVSVDQEKIRAELKDGILRIVLPKKDDRASVSIDIA